MGAQTNEDKTVGGLVGGWVMGAWMCGRVGGGVCGSVGGWMCFRVGGGRGAGG